MHLECNIDVLGRLLRGATGALLLFSGLMMWFWAIPDSGLPSRLLQIVIAASGAFCLFEAVVGWCALRAMGLRTPW